MFSLNASQRFYIYVPATDMRKGFDSLCGMVSCQMGRDPLGGEVFIFINRTRTVIKLLHWERGGLVIYHKRLEQGRFALPRYDEETQSYSVSWHELVFMIEGISNKNVKYRKRFEKISKPA